MPVLMVSYISEVTCSWNSSMMAQDGLEPSPGRPIMGSNLDPSEGLTKDLALTSKSKYSTRSGVLVHISLAGRNTSHACFSEVAPEYTSAPNSPSAQNMYKPT